MFFIKNYFAIFELSVKRTLVNDTFSITFNNGKMNEEINMQEAEKNRDKATKSRIGYLFGIIMLLIYLTMAYLLAFTPYFEATFNPTLRYIFAAVFAAYAIFRGYRFIKG